MYKAMLVGLALVLMAAASTVALECRELTMRDDVGMEPLYDCYMQYYYYIRYDPPTSGSWFWYWDGWETGDRLGAHFTVGDLSMWTGLACDPVAAFTIEQIRILDFAGYGTVHPGWWSVEFDVYCSDAEGCPVGPPIHTTPRLETYFGWNYIDFDPFVCLPVGCAVNPGPPPSGPRILVTATHTGRYGFFPAWGFDNISKPLQYVSPMHDESCLEALYPRPYNSYYPSIHSGFYGFDFTYCPPLWFKDRRDTTPDATQYGYVELAWRIYLTCSGPTGVESSTWGRVKSMYK